MKKVLEEYWNVTYRTQERIKTDMSYMGAHWDTIEYSKWEDVGIDFISKKNASECYWAYVDQGYDCRFKYVRVEKTIENAFPYGRKRNED